MRVHSKGGRECLLPMPADVGEAIAAYLERGRPATADRHLFLRAMAPIRSCSDAIGSIVRYGLASGPRSRLPNSVSHRFTHWPSACLNGAPRSPRLAKFFATAVRKTTSIYARVDIGALRRLALPWPGGAR